MIHTINYAITRFFDFILYPFAFISPFWGILFLSILMSFVVLYFYKWISSPRLVKSAKNKIKADILAIRLYKDLWKVILKSFLKSLFHTVQYFCLNFMPLFIIIPLLFPVFAQMDVRYGKQPFDPGDSFIIKASFSQNPKEMKVELLENQYFKPVMNPVYINAFVQDEGDGEKKPIREVNWKVKALKPGATTIGIKVNGRVYEKNLVIGGPASDGAEVSPVDRQGAMSNKKMKESSWAHFLYPAEPLLPGDGVLQHVYIRYPGTEVSFAGITLYWIFWNLILVVIVVLALKNRFGIEF